MLYKIWLNKLVPYRGLVILEAPEGFMDWSNEDHDRVLGNLYQAFDGHYEEDIRQRSREGTHLILSQVGRGEPANFRVTSERGTVESVSHSTRRGWKQAVAQGTTVLGFADWVAEELGKVGKTP